MKLRTYLLRYIQIERFASKIRSLIARIAGDPPPALNDKMACANILGNTQTKGGIYLRAHETKKLKSFEAGSRTQAFRDEDLIQIRSG
jgi:hypothetical protein